MSDEMKNDSILLESLGMKPSSSRQNLSSTLLTEKNIGRVFAEDKQQLNVKAKVENSFQSNGISSSSSNFFQTLKSVCKSGIITVYFLTTKCKKTYYAQLNDRTFEMHNSEKAQKKRKNAKYIVDLSTCFNVSIQSFPKFSVCVSLMTPDETLLFKDKKESDTNEWYEMMMSAIIPSRALRLGRPVFKTEFFECAWDVILKANPKIRNIKSDTEQLPNICVKRLELANERQRLCIYPHSIVLCRFGIDATNEDGSGIARIPPFRTADFIEFPRSYIKNFGVNGKYFFMRIGRLSNIGACEVWIQPTFSVCEPEEGATEIYLKVKAIIDRENAKQRNGILPLFGNKIGLNKPIESKSTNSIILPSLSSKRHMSYLKSSASKLSLNNINQYNKKEKLPTESNKLNVFTNTATTSNNIDNACLQNDRKKTVYNNTCERCGESFGYNSKEYDELCCEFYATACNYWEQPLPGAGDETEDSGGTLRLNYVSNTCNNSSINSFSNDKKKIENLGLRANNYCNDQMDFYNESDIENNNVKKTKVFVESYSAGETLNKSINDKLEPTLNVNNKKDYLCNCKCKYENLSLSKAPLSVLQSVNNNKKNLCYDFKEEQQILPKMKVLTLSSMSLTDKIKENLSKQSNFLNNPITSTESTSKNLSTSSLNSNSGHLSSSFCGDCYYLCSKQCVAQSKALSSNSFNSLPYHARTVSCSDSAYDSEKVVANTVVLSIKKRNAIAEESFVSETLQQDNTSSSTNEACYSSNGSASFFPVPYDNHLINTSSAEETCSYASDSGDSCYSSMANSNLNSRAFSFSSDAAQTALKHNLNASKWCTACSTNNESYSIYQCRLNSNSNNGSPKTKYCNCFNCKNQKNSFHFNLPSSVSDDLNNDASLLNKTQENNCIENIQDQQLLHNDKMIKEKEQKHQSVTLLNQNNLSLAANEIEHLGTTIVALPNLKSNSKKDKHYLKKQLPKIYSTIDQSFFLQSNTSIEDLRRRTFSLGSASWIRKSFRKLSFGNNTNRFKNYNSKSGSSSPAVSVSDTNNMTTDSIKMFSDSRQPSSSSFASSNGTYSFFYGRSDSIDSNHSFFYPNNSVMSNRHDGLPLSSASLPPTNRFYFGPLSKKYAEKPINKPSDDLIEFECGQVLGPSPSSSVDQIMLIEPLLSIFSSNTQPFQADNSSSSDRNSICFSSRRSTAEKVMLQNKRVKSTISLSPSLTSSALKSQDSDSNNQTPKSARRLIHDTPSLLTSNSISFAKISSEDYIDENEFEMSNIHYKPEKPTSIARKLREVPCFMSGDDQAKLDQLAMLLNEKQHKSSNKHFNNNIYVGSSDCGASIISSGSIAFETINENVSGRSSKSSKMFASKANNNENLFEKENILKNESNKKQNNLSTSTSLLNSEKIANDCVSVICSPYNNH